MLRKRAFLILGIVVASLAVLAAAAGAQGSVVTSVKVDAAPVLDDQIDAVWSQATEVSIPVAGGANMGSTTVMLRSVYTGDSVYFLAHWADPTQSLRRSPWQKQADGSWKKLSTSTTHQENTNYEDKFAMIWNINIAGFEQQGCMILCHAGEQPANSGYGSKYTANAGETGDIWHWKSVRTGPVGQIDDQYVDSTRYDKDKAPEAGRKSDAKTGGGYADNQTDDKTMPKYGAKDNKPAPLYWIPDAEKVAFDDSKYKAGDEVAGILVAPFTGDRGDLTSNKVEYRNGHWYLEWGRKLNTGSKTDVQFTDLTKKYAFGVAVFDNAQVNHAFQSGASQLEFKPAAVSVPPTGSGGLDTFDTGPLWALLGFLVLAGTLIVVPRMATRSS